jgi:hypothetical protein
VKFIKTLQVDPALLLPFPGNAKLHDDDELDASVKRFEGQFRAVLARQLPDGGMQLLAGHGTTAALSRAGLKKVRVELISADDEEALAIVVADNQIGRAAGYDEKALAELLGRLDEGAGFAGTGFDSQAFDDLMAKLAEAADTPLPLGDEDNTWKADTAQDERDRYELKGTRTVAFDYAYPVFVWLAETLAGLREVRSVDSNSDLFVRLVEEASGTTAPESLGETPGDGAETSEDHGSGAGEYAADGPGGDGVPVEPEGFEPWESELSDGPR